MQIKENNIELSIVIPCLNEENTIGICIKKAQTFLKDNNVLGEIIVADNGSEDNSVKIAKDLGANIIYVEEKGYGSALIGGINAAQGKYIIMGDADDSYDFLSIMPFLEKLRQGYDMVIGNRFKTKIQKGAMPWMHKYIGNPFLSAIGRLFFRSKIGDFHCGMRAFTKESFIKMDLRTKGMEFASEMIVKAELLNLRISEVSTILYPDGRNRKSHLRPFHDGWRHLRFLMIYSPRWLFFYPGLMIMLIGIVSNLLILFQPSSKIDIHTLLYTTGAIMIGFQAVIFAIYSKNFAIHEKLLPKSSLIESIINKITPERGLVIGILMVILGISAGIYTVSIWEEGTFFKLGVSITMRIVIASFTLIVMGFQIIFSSFFLNFLKLNTK